MFAIPALSLHIGYALLLAAMIVGNARARWLIGLAAAILGVHAFYWHSGWVAIGWTAGIVLCGAFLGLAALTRNGAARFSVEDAAMRDSLLTGVSPSAARHFIDRGYWISGEAGEALTREGEDTAHLVYLFSGDATVTVSGRKVATCHAGDLIGEASALTGEPATATVVLETPARFWCAEAGALRAYITANQEVRNAIGRNFSHTLRMKLLETSRALALATAEV
ncbi:cyclic nucleotide-binding domain-containing protein [Sphingomonas sp. GB1N7]|uniref:cyclic nucleotide-binding domain-containing protein n=1 Tax=Parasphingomonas caseinilytica TaxID=3096158 RepID=UPI002FC87974